jgi:hypothetical protein
VGREIEEERQQRVYEWQGKQGREGMKVAKWRYRFRSCGGGRDW